MLTSCTAPSVKENWLRPAFSVAATIDFERLYVFTLCTAFNAAPVVFRWKYKMDEIFIV